MRVFTVALVSVAFCIACHPTGASGAEAGSDLLERYTGMLDQLRTELTAKVPQNDQAKADTLNKFLASDALDAKFAKYVVLLEATPQGLAEFAQQGKEQAALVEKMLADADLMKQMLVADGANAKREGRGYGPAQYGQAMKIYTDIQKASKKAASGVLQRLALAISLEHAVPIEQANPTAQTDAPDTIDPVKRYLHYEKAYLDGELDPAFERLSTWELRMVVNGDEPDETLAWGREMLRNYRPDHIYNSNYGWRYVSIVSSDVKYGSGDVKYDRPELQRYQNILMNGGVCGRRAFIGRFILRAFGIPTTARPSRGHAALAHWTPKGWVVNLGGGWGAGWTKHTLQEGPRFPRNYAGAQQPGGIPEGQAGPVGRRRPGRKADLRGTRRQPRLLERRGAPHAAGHHRGGKGRDARRTRRGPRRGQRAHGGREGHGLAGHARGQEDHLRRGRRHIDTGRRLQQAVRQHAGCLCHEELRRWSADLPPAFLPSGPNDSARRHVEGRRQRMHIREASAQRRLWQIRELGSPGSRDAYRQQDPA